MAEIPNWLMPQTMTTATIACMIPRGFNATIRIKCAYCGGYNKDSKGNCEGCGANEEVKHGRS